MTFFSKTSVQKIKPYKKVTEASGKLYDDKLDKAVRKGTNVVLEVLKTIPQ